MTRFSFLSILFVMLFSLTQFSAAAQNCSCPGDINGDGAVTGSDLIIFIDAMGQGSCTGCCSDINDDGLVNGADLVLFLAVFGSTCNNQNASDDDTPNSSNIKSADQRASAAYRNNSKAKQERRQLINKN